MSNPTRIGYARCAESPADVDEMTAALAALQCDRMYLDTGGLTGPHHVRPELERALAACNRGDVLVVPSLARFVTSLADAPATLTRLADAAIRLEINGSLATSAGDKAYLRAFADAAQLASALIRLHTRAGLANRRRTGKPLGGRSKLDPDTRATVRRLHDDGKGISITTLANDYAVSRATISRAINSPDPQPPQPKEQTDAQPTNATPPHTR